MIKTNPQAKSTRLSVQQIIDCDKATGNLGCDGGSVNKAYIYAKANYLTSDSEYPFIDVNKISNQACLLNTTIQPQLAKLVANYTVTPRVAASFNEALGKSVVAMYINQTCPALVSYKSGIIDLGDCVYESTSSFDHAVLLIGNGTGSVYDPVTNKRSSISYWIIRNTWGSDWGDNGYFKVR